MQSDARCDVSLSLNLNTFLQSRQQSFNAAQGEVRVNDANFGTPSDSSVAATQVSALVLGGQIGLINSQGGINTDRLSKGILQSGVQNSLGQEVISQMVIPQNGGGSQSSPNQQVRTIHISRPPWDHYKIVIMSESCHKVISHLYVQ